MKKHHASQPRLPRKILRPQTVHKHTAVQTGGRAVSIFGPRGGKAFGPCRPRFAVCCDLFAADLVPRRAQLSAECRSLRKRVGAQCAHPWGGPVRPWFFPRGWETSAFVSRFSLPETVVVFVPSVSSSRRMIFEDEFTTCVCRAATQDKSREALVRKHRTFFPSVDLE